VTVICALPGPEFTSEAVAMSGREFEIVNAPVYPGSTTEIVFVALASPRRITRFVSLGTSLLVAAFDVGAGARNPIGENRRRRAALACAPVKIVIFEVTVPVVLSDTDTGQVTSAAVAPLTVITNPALELRPPVPVAGDASVAMPVHVASVNTAVNAFGLYASEAVRIPLSDAPSTVTGGADNVPGTTVTVTFCEEP
jgi:hypothetical protein